MTAPLSGIQKFPRQTAGMFGGPRGRIMEGGAYTATGVGDPTKGYNGDGWYWQQYPYVISGITGYATPSTETGAPANTYVDSSDSKVGGGVNTAVDTSAPTDGQSQGGTAAY